MTPRALGICLVLLVVASGCESSDSGGAAATPPTESPTAATTTTPPAIGEGASSSTAEGSVPAASEDIDNGLMVASAYLDAATARNYDEAMSYLAKSVHLDWGPAATPEELEAAWAWEDAFAVRHTLDSCEHIDRDPASKVTARCRLLVESEVAAAAGHEPQHVCAEIEVEDGLITEVVGLDSREGCPLVYWEYMFVPFSEWLAEAHPDKTVPQLYNDRMSPEGLRLWSEYTEEYLNDHATSRTGETDVRDAAGLQSIADAAQNLLIYVSDPDGITTAASGEGDNGQLIEPNDVFFLGSGSKMITAAAILQLVDQGLVGLDDLLADYVEFDVSTPITIRHLLQHKSGLPDDGSIYDTCDPDEVVDGLAGLAIRPANREPGAEAEYSTDGFNMLSLVMSSATGQSAAAVVRQNIFEPLEMTSTFFTGAEDGPMLVVGQDSWDPECAADRMDIGTGGGFATSASDLDVFMRALFQGDLLTDESLNEMMTVDSQVYGIDYGLGLGLLHPPKDGDQPMYGHWGTYGWDAGALYDPDRQRTVAVLAPNQDFLSTAWEAVDWAEGR